MRNACRICGGTDLVKVLDLGMMPNANTFLTKAEFSKEQSYPLEVYFCQKCKLVQLLEVVDPRTLFGHYDYLTGASKPLADHFVELGNYLTYPHRFLKSKEDLVVDIGGNDGTFLENIKDLCRVLNIEPARNIAQISRKKDIYTINKFFSRLLAEEILQTDGQARIITASNVMAHINDLKDVFRGIEVLLDKSGTFIMEVHWLGNLLGEGGFDQIYHEHLCYFSFHALFNLVSQFDMKISDVKFEPIHGQSMQVFIEKVRIRSEATDSTMIGCDTSSPTWGLHELLFLKERSLGLDKIETFREFNRKVSLNKGELISCLDLLKQDGKRIVGYGAPAKGNTLINYCGIGEYIDYIIDTTPLKQGLYTPGSHIPIYPPDKMKENPPDYVLLLAWNYKESIISKERETGFKGHFIIPVPEVQIV